MRFNGSDGCLRGAAGSFLILLLAFAPVHAKKLRLFVIGNSFSGNATTFLPDLAAAGGHELVIGRAELGACSFERHWKHAAAAEADSTDPAGKPYKGKSLKQLLSEGEWDVITMQQYSLLSGDTATYEPYARKLYEYVRALQPRAQIMVHQTWAYRADARQFGQIDGGKRASDFREMWKYSRAAYRKLADKWNAGVLPSGDAFYLISQDRKYGYRKDPRFNYEKPVYPQLPDQTNSLHVGYFWSGEKEFRFDANHANAAGCYLAGLVWYARLFNETPRKVKFVPEKVSGGLARKMQKVAAGVVKAGRKEEREGKAPAKVAQASENGRASGNIPRRGARFGRNSAILQPETGIIS